MRDWSRLGSIIKHSDKWLIPWEVKMALTNIRRSGILLHPTSFPGPWGVGDLGPIAYAFVDFLNDMET